MWANNTRLWREITSPELRGRGLPTPSHCCLLLFCLLSNVFLIWDMSGKQTCPLQLLQFLFYRESAPLCLKQLSYISCDCLCLISVTLPKGPAPALELKKPLKRLAARFFQLSGPAPGREPPSPRASGAGILVSPRNSVMFFLRRAWPCNAKRTDRGTIT